MSKARQCAAWTKRAVHAWSGRPISEILLDLALSSPPFPNNREALRQYVNETFRASDQGYKAIDRGDWEQKIKATSTVRDVRDLACANRGGV
jgi:hypothetical protein